MSVDILRANLPFEGDLPTLARMLRTQEDPESELYQKASQLLDRWRDRVRPGFLLRQRPLGRRSGQALLDGVALNSKIVARQTKKNDTAYLYVITCGREINDVLEAEEDLLDRYILDQIAYMGFLAAKQAMRAAVEELGIHRYVMMAPGSIIDWSVAENAKLFAALGPQTACLGLQVLESGLLDPLKSACGFFVPSEEEFTSCDICPRPGCPNRLTTFDEEKHEAMLNL